MRLTNQFKIKQYFSFKLINNTKIITILQFKKYNYKIVIPSIPNPTRFASSAPLNPDYNI